MTAYEITDIQVFKYQDPMWDIEYSANVAINDQFMIQLGTDGKWSIPHPDEACWKDEDAQGNAYESLDVDNLVELLSPRKEVQRFISLGIFE